MINAVLVFNNAGQPRLTKFYTQLVCPRSTPCLGAQLTSAPQETSVQQRLISEIFTLVSHRPDSACNFLPYVGCLRSAAEAA